MKSSPWMFLFLWLGAAGVAQATDSQACSLKKLASVELSVGEDILVPVQSHGQRLWMVLDLGEPFSLVSPSAVEALRLRSESLDGRPDGLRLEIGGRHITAIATVNSLSIGSYRIGRRDFFVDPRAHTTENLPGQNVLGSLGIGELWSVDVELDLAHRRLNLYSPEHCLGAAARALDYRARIPVELNELGNVYFPVELDGSKIEASISTTDRDTYMSEDVSRQLFGFDEHSPEVQVLTDATGTSHHYFRAMTLRSGDLTLSNVSVRLTPPVKSCTLSKTGVFGDVPEFKGRGDHLCYAAYPLVLGIRTIERLQLYFATGEKTIYFKMAEPAE